MALNRDMFRNFSPSQPIAPAQITPEQQDPIMAEATSMGMEYAADKATPVLEEAFAPVAEGFKSIFAPAAEVAAPAIAETVAGAAAPAIAETVAGAAAPAIADAAITGTGAALTTGTTAGAATGLAALGPMAAAAAPVAIPLLIAAKMFKVF